MTGAYQLTRSAERELDELVGFVAERDGVERALGVLSKFVGAFERLARMPMTGSTRPSITGDGVRWLVVFQWLVVYEPTSKPLTILRIIHGARDIGRFLDAEEDR